MQIKFGPYYVRTHELDNKLSVQVTSDSGKASIREDDNIYPFDFPNGIHFQIENISEAPAPKGLKRYAFGDYTFILGINNSGYLCLFYSLKLYVNRKIIDDIDTLTLSFLAEPKA
jgi:hypothetical protein